MRELFAAQSVHQKVDESPCARFPCLVGIPITHADHRAQQVRGSDVFAYRTTVGSAFHKRCHRPRDQFSRVCTQCGRLAGRSQWLFALA